MDANWKYTGYQERTHTFGKKEKYPSWVFNIRPFRAEAGHSVSGGQIIRDSSSQAQDFVWVGGEKNAVGPGPEHSSHVHEK